MDSTIISNSQSCETADNELMQLKSYGSLCKNSSLSIQLIDTQRAKDHRNGHLLQDIDCQPKLVTQNSEESASECDNLLLSAVQENSTSIQQSDSPEQDSGFSQNMETTDTVDSEAKPDAEVQPSECNTLDSKNEKKLNKHSGTKHHSVTPRAWSAQRSFPDWEQRQYEYEHRHRHHYRPYRPYGHGYWNSSSTKYSDNYDFT